MIDFGLVAAAALFGLAASAPMQVPQICSVMNGERICVEGKSARPGYPAAAPGVARANQQFEGPVRTATRLPSVTASRADRPRRRSHYRERRRYKAYERVYRYERRGPSRHRDESEDVCVRLNLCND